MEHKPSYSFPHLSKTVRVTLLDVEGTEQLTGSKLEMSRGLIFENPPEQINKPMTGVGVICPATFEVEGLDVHVTFSIGIAPSKRHKYPNSHDIVITSLTSTMTDLDSLKTIPTRKLLAAAIRAAGVVVMHYPAGYDGYWVGYTDNGEIVENKNIRVTTDKDEQYWELCAYRVADENAAYMYAGVPDVVSPDQRLRDVAKIVKAHPRRFTREVSQRIGVTERHAGRLIYAARQAGYLPPSTRKAPK